jgi:hypothetical protein
MLRKEKESGQSILIIAFIVLVLLALVALVVDVGNAYAHRRMVQNAVDAAALAGARVLAFRGTTDPPEPVTHNEVMAAVNAYAELNGLAEGNVRAEFILENGTTTPVLQSYAMVPWKPSPAVGVRVEGDLPFDTYFAHLLGFPTMVATTDAAAYHIIGPCSRDDCIFPVIVSWSLFDEEPEGLPLLETPYVLWEQSLKAPGNFGWIYWVDDEGDMRGEPPQGPEVTSLEPNLLDNCRSGAWFATDRVHGDVGVNFQPVLDILEDYITDGITVTVPFYSDVELQGNNGVFTISSFGVFRLTCAHASRAHYAEVEEGVCDAAIDDPDNELDKNSKFLIGVFERGYDPMGFEDGCADTGVSGVSMRPPKSLWMPEWREDE